MTQPQNNLAAIDKKIADAKQADAANAQNPGQQNQAGQNQAKPGDLKVVQPDADKSGPAQQGSSPASKP